MLGGEDGAFKADAAGTAVDDSDLSVKFIFNMRGGRGAGAVVLGRGGMRLKGIGVSPGVVAGRAVVLIQRDQVLRYQIAPARVAHELRRLDESRAQSREQLIDIRARVAERRPELASLFDAQLLMLDDPMVLPRAADIVRESRVNAEWAVQQVFHEFSAVFDEVADPYDLWMTCAVNGEERMRVNTRDQIWKLPDLLEHFSRYIAIEPGDMFATGAPGGVAVGKPNAAELFLKPGDVVECSIEGVATLRTHIVSPGLVEHRGHAT